MSVTKQGPLSSQQRSPASSGSDATSTASEVATASEMGPDASARDRFFDTSHLGADLKTRALRSGVFTVGGQLTSKAIQFGGTMVLARILTPRDYGLLAMITVVTGFVEQFKDLGLSMATVQRQQITHEQVSTLFWINVGLSAVLMLVAMALAPALAWFYGEPQLLWLTVALAASFIFGGLTVQHQALLRRQMRFKALAAIQVAVLVVGVSVGIAAALAGAGVWALIYYLIASAFANAVAVWLVCAWRPGLPRRGSGVRGMLAFGGNLTGFKFVNYFARNLDNLLIGKVWGTAQLGLYSKAYALLLLPVRQITGPVSAVAIPTLSRLQDDPERYRRYFLKAVSLVAGLTMPAVAFMILMSDEIVLLALGNQWAEAAPIFRMLGVAAIVQPTVSTCSWLYISNGRADRMLRWGVFSSVILVGSFLIGLPYGAIGVATSYALCMLLLTFPSMWYASRPTPVPVGGIVAAMWHPALATASTGVVLAGFTNGLPRYSTGVSGLMLGVAITSIVYLLVSSALARGAPPVLEVISLCRGSRQR